MQTESHNKVLAKLDSISEIVNILKVDQQTIKNALDTGFPDFEDSIQYCCARDNKRIDVLITRNTKDFKHSEIPIMTPADFLKMVST